MVVQAVGRRTPSGLNVDRASGGSSRDVRMPDDHMEGYEGDRRSDKPGRRPPPPGVWPAGPLRQPHRSPRRSDGMKVVVAGGTGMIGGALTRALAGAGGEVVVLTRRPVEEAGSLPAGARAARWTPAEPAGAWAE